VVVEVAHVIERSIGDAIRLAVNGTLLAHELQDRHGVLSASVRVAPGTLLPGSTARVEIAVDRTARPCDVNPGSCDCRELSIAVQRVALVSRAGRSER
jgi:hypothetical protein